MAAYVKRQQALMYTNFLYIALYDPDKNEICFELALHNNDLWEGVHGSKRLLDKSQLGKTEKIILTGEPILHYTRVESEKWYKEPGHKEHAGNALASWLGVPIYSERGVIGVIATYHESLDFIFSERDQFFLQQIAGDVAGMLRALELEQAKNRLQKAHNTITLREGQLARESLAQDLAHRWKNSISGIQVRTQDSLDLLHDETKKNHVEKNLNAILHESVKILEKMDFSPDSIPERENFSPMKIITEIAEHLAIEYDLDDFSVFTIESGDEDFSLFNYKILFNNCFYALLENAFRAVKEKKDITTNYSPYIKITIKKKVSEVDFYVEDNGVPIPKDLRDAKKLLSFSSKNENNPNSSGYGLYRTGKIVALLGGRFDITSGIEGDYNVKKFKITLPSIENKNKTAVIVEDQNIWIDPLREWLEDEGFTVSWATSYEQALSFCKGKYTSNDLFIVDIALDENNDKNRSGLKIINKLRKHKTKPKLVIFSSYHDAGRNFTNKVDLIIKKYNNGKAISKKNFITKIQGLYKNNYE